MLKNIQSDKYIKRNNEFMLLTKNFTLEEFLKSSTATRYKIDNTIPEKYMKNLHSLVELMLIIRDAWNAPIKISSGYRCSKLNTKVGGVKTSDHLYAAACDFSTLSDSSSDNKKLYELILQLAKEKKVHFRLIIDEYNYNWIHCSVNNDYNSKKDNQEVHVK